jgi:L-iditol 2-dehydrogenase
MKALVLTAYKEVRVQEFPDPHVGPTDVLVRVEACGICGSDIHGFDGSTGRRRPPLVMGHEAAGVIVQVGSEVIAHRVGDRVTFDSTIYDPKSFFSRRGQINLCDDRRVFGVSCEEYRQHGAFAELVAVPQHILYDLPESMTFREAALVEPVSIAVHACRLTPIEDGDSALVVGAGLIGLTVVQVLKNARAEHIIAVDLDDARLALARRLGATHTVNPKRVAHLSDTIRAVTGGRGADVAFEAVGIETTVRAAVDGVRKGGTVTLIGNLSPNVSLPLQSLVTRQIRLQGSCASSGEYPECLDLIASRKVDVESFISAEAPLEQGPAWFDRLYRQEPGLMKVLLKPNG